MSEIAEPIEDAEIVSQAPQQQSTSLAVRDNTVQAGLTTESAFSLAERVANVLCSSTIVPAAYRGESNKGNCVIALHMAARLNADPIQVMQNLFVIEGKPTWSSQFLIAVFNSCGQFSKIRYRMTGTKGQDNFGCIAYATELATNEVLEGTEVTIAIAKAEGWFGRRGSKWQTLPEQMLKYRAAAWFIRSIAPELSMGLHTADEQEDISNLDVTVSAVSSKPTEPATPIVNPLDLIKQKAAAVVESPHTPAIAEALAPINSKPTTFTPDPGCCNAEQKAEIERLFVDCGFDSAAQATILNKRGVGAIRSLTELQAEELITIMRAKLETVQRQPGQDDETLEPEPIATEHAGQHIHGPCTPAQLQAIQDALLDLEKIQPGVSDRFVSNLDKYGIQADSLTWEQANGVIAAIHINEIEAFFDKQLSMQPA